MGNELFSFTFATLKFIFQFVLAELSLAILFILKAQSIVFLMGGCIYALKLGKNS